MNIESSSTHASPVSQPDVPHVSAPPLDISHYVTEDLVPVPTSTGVPTSVDSNAPPALDTATPARIGFLSRLFGSNGLRQQPEEESYITDRRRAVGPGAVSASPSEDQRLLQLQISAEATEQRLITSRMETEIAELDARKAAVEAALAQSHQRTHALERESTDNLGASRSPSPPCEGLRRSPRRSHSPQSEVAALMQLFQQQQQQAADREQRREERRDEQRREDRREAAEREARLEARLAEREARVEARLLQNPSIASVGYRIGSAAKEFRPFEGKEDGAAYILELTHLLGTHEVPVTQWPRELSLKLKGSAANWYAARFPDLPVGTFPPWSEFYAAMLHTYSQSYGAAGAYQDLHNLRRLPGSTGKEAYARVEEHSMLLRRKGVHNPGPEEQHAYILQNQLTAGESARWISLANADEKISDAALNALELGTADARTGRLSCPPPTREAFFAARREHLRNFLNEQGPATTGDRSMGSSSARAAVSTGNDTAEPPTPPSEGAPPSSPAATPADRAAVVARLQAQHMARGSDTEKPPPRYYGTPECPDLSRNAKVFAERRASRACFGCTPAQLEAQGPIPHWRCKYHGQDASDADRVRRVDGSGPATIHRR